MLLSWEDTTNYKEIFNEFKALLRALQRVLCFFFFCHNIVSRHEWTMNFLNGTNKIFVCKQCGSLFSLYLAGISSILGGSKLSYKKLDKIIRIPIAFFQDCFTEIKHSARINVFKLPFLLRFGTFCACLCSYTCLSV